MCNACNDRNHEVEPVQTARRKFLISGATGLATAAALAAAPGVAAGASSARSGSQTATRPFETRAFGTTAADQPIRQMRIRRRAMQPKDVLVDVLYTGICHTDVHLARNHWPTFFPTQWPVVPGHEIVGRVAAIGSQVTKFKVGDTCGVGCLIKSCGECDNCKADLEQYCLRGGPTQTYNWPDSDFEGHTFGGFSDRMVVPEHFVLRVPSGVDLPAFAPLLCAGLTTFSPMQRWKIERGQRVGVVGLGGLGHMAVKFGAERGADVTVFTTSIEKIADASRFGARNVVVWTDPAAMEKAAGQFDYVIVTIPYAYEVGPFVNLLKTRGTLINVGNMEQLQEVSGAGLIFAGKEIAGSLIGGLAETQQVIDYCAARNIKADIELIRPDQINAAMDAIVAKRARYRFVIDMTAGRSAA
jgi:uncharacterized zinc-type alcohol dehydrogenase-like protein